MELFSRVVERARGHGVDSRKVLEEWLDLQSVGVPWEGFGGAEEELGLVRENMESEG